MFTPMKKKIDRVLKTKSSRIILILSLIFLILNATYEIRTTTIQPPSYTFYFMPQSETLLYSFSIYDSVQRNKFDFEKCNHWGEVGYRGTAEYKDVTFCDKQVYPENVDMGHCFIYNQKKIPDDYACTFAKTKKSRADIFRSKVDKDYREYYFDITISFFRVIIFSILPFLVFFIIRAIVLWVSRGT
tara:strand:+ start:350 stop:910 length:561 start_codon:yes stop_codon:yes gene_type:complete